MRKWKIFNFRPILFTVVFLSAGVLFARLKLLHGLSLGFVSLVPLLAGIVCFFGGEVKRPLSFILSVCLLSVGFAVGEISFSRRVDRVRALPDYVTTTEDGETLNDVTLVGTVDGIYHNKYGTRVLLIDVYIDGEKTESAVIAYLGASFSEELSFCDRVVAEASITKRTLISGNAIDAGSIVDKRYYTAKVDSLSVAGRDGDIFRNVRARIHERLYDGMDETTAAVTYATLVGDTSGIDNGLLENIRSGGIAHIFAVSGLHVGALYAFCLLLISKTKLSSLPALIRIFLLAGVLLFYAGICGFSPSVVRAAIMCVIAFGGTMYGMKTDFIERISLAAGILLLIDPAYLFDTGFLLSFVACYSIAVFSPAVRAAFTKIFPDKNTVVMQRFFAGEIDETQDGEFALTLSDRVKNAIAAFLSVTISAQIGTAPVLLVRFGSLSPWALILNCLFVPLLSALFAILLALVLISCLLPASAAPVILYLPSVVWSALLLVFEGLDFSAAITLTVGASAILLYYLAFIFPSGKMNFYRREKKFLTILSFLAFAATMSLMNL